jgi:hypothetical protein
MIQICLAIMEKKKNSEAFNTQNKFSIISPFLLFSEMLKLKKMILQLLFLRKFIRLFLTKTIGKQIKFGENFIPLVVFIK